ncbi:MAG: hypothetical protein AAGC53_12120 [Actinomycetota bacterium]
MRRLTARLRRFFREARAEWRGRRDGRKGVPKGAHPIRHIVGPTGNMFSNGWSEAAKGADAFQRSFDPRIPPSIHVSHNDAMRTSQVVPLVERCIEDWNDPTVYADPHDELDLSEGRRSETPGHAG